VANVNGQHIGIPAQYAAINVGPLNGHHVGMNKHVGFGMGSVPFGASGTQSHVGGMGGSYHMGSDSLHVTGGNGWNQGQQQPIGNSSIRYKQKVETSQGPNVVGSDGNSGLEQTQPRNE